MTSFLLVKRSIVAVDAPEVVDDGALYKFTFYFTLLLLFTWAYLVPFPI